MSKVRVIYTCERCGKKTGRFGRWFHTYFAWPWWKPFDKSGPRRCVSLRRKGA